MTSTDAELWGRARGGDATAFGELYQRHVRAVQSYCLWRTAAEQLAEDVTATVFLEAWRCRRRLDLRTESAAPLLLGVATNVLRNYWRSQRRHARALERLGRLDALTTPGDEDAAIARIDAMSRVREAGAAIRALPTGEREVLALLAWGELSYAETAADRRCALESELRPPRRRRRLRRPRRRLAVALVALVALGGGAAWATGVFSAEEISYQAGVACYSEARPHGPNLSATGFPAAADPVAKCEKYWREGVVDTTQRRLGREGKIDYPPHPYPPHLVACSKPGSGIAVFPGTEAVCERFGLQPLPDDYEAPGREAARAYTSWNRILARRFQILEAGRCLAPEPIAARSRRLLAAAGYGDVPVGIASDGPCAKAVEPRGRTIMVITTSRREDEVSRLAERVQPGKDPGGHRRLRP